LGSFFGFLLLSTCPDVNILTLSKNYEIFN
jgi:hypothetical protein